MTIDDDINSERSGESVEAATERVRQLLRLGRAEIAADTARRALVASPDHDGCRALLVDALIDLDQTGEALDQAEIGCRLAPLSGLMHEARAYALRTNSQTSASIAASRTAVHIDPGNVRFLMTHSQCLAQHAARLPRFSKRRARAIGDAAVAADHALTLTPNQSGVHFVRAQVHQVAREWLELEASAHRGLALDPTNALGHELLGTSRSKQRDFTAASNHFVSAGRADSQSNGAGLLDSLARRRALWVGLPMFLVARILISAQAPFEAWAFCGAATVIATATWLLFSRRTRFTNEAKTARRRRRTLK